MQELLIMGRDSAAQLQALLQDHGPGLAQVLTEKILRSFDGVLSVVMTPPLSPSHSGEVQQIPESSGDRSCVDSGESGKRPAVKDRRGGYKRRRNSDSRIQVSDSMEDGYAWRKYGQKAIQNANYPRCYYRCTHKPDQGCLALKQVQVIAEGPQKYQITYFGYHTCKKVKTKPSNIILDFYPEDPNLISFEPTIFDPESITKINPPVKEEIQEEKIKEPTNETGITFWTDDDLMAYNKVDWSMEGFMDFVDFEYAFSS